MIKIDGQIGEGGGQILRSSLSLSLITKKPFHLKNIRAGRKKPGLMRQHLTAVRAAAQIGCAHVEGDEINSKEIIFRPETVCPGQYHFSIGTAGSTTLVLQTILPPLCLADKPSKIILEGGTHNPLSPPYEFLKQTFLPIINRMGPQVDINLLRYGFAPAGGGSIEVFINPVQKITPIDIIERGDFKRRSATTYTSMLESHIPQRELDQIKNKLNWNDSELVSKFIKDSNGPGNILLAKLVYNNITETFAGFGQVGTSAEKVGTHVAQDIKKYLQSNVPVGHYLADQLLLFFALSGSGSFLTLPLSMHSKTNIEVIQYFLDCCISTEEDKNKSTLISIKSKTTL